MQFTFYVHSCNLYVVRYAFFLCVCVLFCRYEVQIGEPVETLVHLSEM